MSELDFAALRRQMVAQIAAQTIFLTARLGKASLDRRVLDVIGQVPRHEFVRLELQPLAYADMPLPSGFDKTISQPFIVALMTDLLNLQSTDTVLEIGTGLGYQAAILAELAQSVYSVEIIEEHAPFDKIIVTAAPDLVPATLLYQLKPGGKMVIPAGLPDTQQLLLVDKDAAGMTTTKEILPVRFSLLEDPEEG